MTIIDIIIVIFFNYLILMCYISRYNTPVIHIYNYIYRYTRMYDILCVA